MAKLERAYNVPLRREWLKVPAYKRAKRAIKALRAFLSKHMKSDDVKLGKHINHKIWERGIKSPPHHVKVNAIKGDDGIVRAELEGHKIEEIVEKEEKKKGKLEELTEKVTGKPAKKKAPQQEEKAKVEETPQEKPRPELKEEEPHLDIQPQQKGVKK
jgi:large subunit ribosomal protein L31e